MVWEIDLEWCCVCVLTFGRSKYVTTCVSTKQCICSQDDKPMKWHVVINLPPNLQFWQTKLGMVVILTKKNTHTQKPVYNTNLSKTNHSKEAIAYKMTLIYSIFLPLIGCIPGILLIRILGFCCSRLELQT